MSIIRAWQTAESVDWDPRWNEAVRNLLDHLARELAEEYIRLMKEAAVEEGNR